MKKVNGTRRYWAFFDNGELVNPSWEKIKVLGLEDEPVIYIKEKGYDLSIFNRPNQNKI